jgi:hypothetical protein
LPRSRIKSAIRFDPEKFKDDPYPHLKHYTPEEFEELLDKANFSVISKFCQKDKKGEITLGTDGDIPHLRLPLTLSGCVR